MENKEIKIKSYLYMQQNMAIALTVIFGVPTVAIAIWLRPFSLGAVLSLSLISLFFLICALVTRLGCRTYDIYNEKVIKRVRGNKVLFEVELANAKSALYQGVESFIFLTPYVLTIWLNKPLKSNENRSYDTIEMISTPMSKKVLKQVEAILPINITHKPNQ